MNLFDKIIRGDFTRKSRFHDAKGNFVGNRGLSNLPRAIWSYTALRLASHHSLLPWISYNAIEKIDRLLNANMNVLEFGSGMSTIWFAQRCGFIHSIEHDEYWHGKVTDLLERYEITNVCYELKTSQDYVDISGYDAPFFDFCLVDGGVERLRSVECAIPMIKSGGFIYLDNSDVGSAERCKAVKLITAAAKRVSGTIEYFTDFPPMTLHVTQGLLARL